MQQRLLILHNIRSALNVGALFRTGDAIAIEKIFLTGYTPLPVDRFGFPDKQIAKTALGAEMSVSWEHRPDIFALLNELHASGVTIVGLEIDPRAVDYKQFSSTTPTAVLLGAEVEGMTAELRSACDVLVSIPMRGSKESLNVSVAAGILLYRLFDS